MTGVAKPECLCMYEYSVKLKTTLILWFKALTVVYRVVNYLNTLIQSIIPPILCALPMVVLSSHFNRLQAKLFSSVLQ